MNFKLKFRNLIFGRRSARVEIESKIALLDRRLRDIELETFGINAIFNEDGRFVSSGVSPLQTRTYTHNSSWIDAWTFVPPGDWFETSYSPTLPVMQDSWDSDEFGNSRLVSSVEV